LPGLTLLVPLRRLPHAAITERAVPRSHEQPLVDARSVEDVAATEQSEGFRLEHDGASFLWGRECLLAYCAGRVMRVEVDRGVR
jgi:hypothetical protein